jgi:flagellar hook-associated protein 1 FlgK
VRASLDTNAVGDPIVRLDLYNPPDSSTTISTFKGSSNFFTLTGLDNAASTPVKSSTPYSDAAGMIQLSTSVRDSLDAIAAAGDDGSGIFPGPGNNTNALAIASLQSLKTAVGSSTFEDFYTSLVGELGAKDLSASQLVDNQSILLDQLSTQRESVMGVSLDEEATNMITYQRIFEGAARVTQVIDSMLDTLVNRLGA